MPHQTLSAPDFQVYGNSAPPSLPPLVTVVIPAHAAASTLGRAIQSVLGQSLKEIEVIIVDDASTDATWPLIADVLPQDERVRAIRHQSNRGKSVAMNRAISIARGRWLAVLDADDWYHRDRLAALVELGERCQAEMVADNQTFYDAPASAYVGTAWPTGDAAWELGFDDFLIGADAYETFNLGMIKPVVRCDFIHASGLMYEEKAKNCQDFFYIMQFYVAGGRLFIIDTPYYYYTQPFGAISRCWSHTGRSHYNFKIACDISEQYLSAIKGCISLRQMGRLAARARQMRTLERYYQVRELFLHRHWGAALGLYARNPRMLDYLLRRIANRLSKHPAYFSKIHRIARRSRHLAPDVREYGARDYIAPKLV